jgi:hypothetical protein
MVPLAATFGALALVLAVMAVAQAQVATGTSTALGSAVAGYAAACFGVLAILYGLRSLDVTVEELLFRTRWTSVILRVALAPYLVLGALILSVGRRLDPEEPRSEIAPGLSIGRLPSRSEGEQLARCGITAILSLCWELPPSRRGTWGGATSMAWEPILDAAPPTERQFRKAVRQVTTWRAEGRSVLVHCAQGHGRSATIAAAVLVCCGEASNADEALARIRAARPRARPSSGQCRAIDRFLESGAPRPL